MKKILFVVLSTLSTFSLFAQNIAGDWNAILKVSGQELPLIFHIEDTDGNYTGTLDSPKQGAFGLKANAITYINSQLTISLAQLGITYEGELQDTGDITGIFKQSGIEIPLNLTKGEAKAVEMNRPQEPKAPFPYDQEDVTFQNETAGITLAGTLTLPKTEEGTRKKHPVAILISGSGAQDRNEELLGHKPFLVLADHLTRNGIAVLRYDDRGTAQSTGDHDAATSADFATDAQAAFDYLLTRNDIDTQKIGYAGHSEGGFIAPMVAAKNKDVAFIALLAGVGQPGDELLTEQGYLIGKAQGMDEEELLKNKADSSIIFSVIKENADDPELMKTKVIDFFRTALTENPDLIPEGVSAEEFARQQINRITTPWFSYFLSTDPAQFLERVSCPVLAINGSLDLQVPSKVNLSGIEKAVKKGGNNDVTIIEIPNLNHLFQTTETGDPAEYATLEETFSPIALDIITNWIQEKTK